MMNDEELAKCIEVAECLRDGFPVIESVPPEEYSRKDLANMAMLLAMAVLELRSRRSA
jgi:hypothetical protein